MEHNMYPNKGSPREFSGDSLPDMKMSTTEGWLFIFILTTHMILSCLEKMKSKGLNRNMPYAFLFIFLYNYFRKAIHMFLLQTVKVVNHSIKKQNKNNLEVVGQFSRVQLTDEFQSDILAFSAPRCIKRVLPWLNPKANLILAESSNGQNRTHIYSIFQQETGANVALCKPK